MKTKWSRIICLCLALCMLTVLFAACKGKDSGDSSSTTGSLDASDATSSAAPDLVLSNAFTINDYAVIALLDGKAKIKAGANVQQVLDALTVEEGCTVKCCMEDGS